MAELAPAARVGDPITHSPMLGLALAGIGAGLVVGVVVASVTVATGGADIPVAMAVAGAVSTICSAMGWGFFVGKVGGWAADQWKVLASVTGAITDGAGTVFIGAGCPAAARYQDPVHCKEPPATSTGAMVLGTILAPAVGALAAAAVVDANSEHAGATMAQGSETVLTEGKSQSRVGDRTICGGTVSRGCETVLVGGAPNAEVSWDAEIRDEVDAAMNVVERVGQIAGVIAQRTTPDRILYASRALIANRATEQGKKPL
jgi:uncharacterized Zn-binding protein involved in type VI secretion